MVKHNLTELNTLAAKYRDVDPAVSEALYEYVRLIRLAQEACAYMEAEKMRTSQSGYELLLASHDYGCWWFQCEDRATHVVRDTWGEHHYLCDKHWELNGKKDAIDPREYAK